MRSVNGGMVAVLLMAGVAVNVHSQGPAEVPNDLSALVWSAYQNSIGIDRANDALLNKAVLRLEFNRGPADGAGGHYGVAVAELAPPIKAPSQYKLFFRLKGCAGNAGTRVTPALTVLEDGKRVYKPARRSIELASRKWRCFTFSLDSDFELGDCVHEIAEVKLIVNSQPLPAGHRTEAWVTDVMIADVGSIERQSGQRLHVDYRVTPPSRQPGCALPIPPVTVYQGLNNGDYRMAYRNGRREIAERGANRLGFGDILAQPLCDYVVNTGTLTDTADVLVLSASSVGRAFPLEQIKAAIESGKGALIFGQNDAAMAPLLPVRVVRDDDPVTAGRGRLRIQNESHPLLVGVVLRETTIGHYLHLEALPGASVLATWDDGTPAIVEGVLGRGRVVYFGFGVGQVRTTIESFYDELYLRAVFYLAGRRDAIPWLAVAARAQALRDEFEDGALIADVLHATGLPAAAASAASVVGVGRKLAALTSTLLLTGPTTAANGTLDDLTTELRTVREQMRTAAGHDYRVGAGRRNFGRFGWALDEGLLVQNVTRKLEVYNMGDFSYCLRAGTESPGPDAASLAVQSADWVHKEYRTADGAGGGYSMVMSLLFPGILYRVNDRAVQVGVDDMRRLAYVGEHGVVTKDLTATDKPVYDVATDGPLAENWMLVYSGQPGETEKPILLVWEKRPVTVRSGKTMGLVDTLTVARDGAIGAVVVSHPFGILAVPGTRLAVLGDDVVSRCRELSRMSLAYPVACDELYAVGANRVRVLDRFRYAEIRDDWGTVPVRIAPVPPQVAYARAKNLLVQSDTAWEDFGVATKYGPFAGLRDRDTVVYELEIPFAENVFYPGIAGEEKLRALIDAQFQEGVKWTCGGRVPFEALRYDANLRDKSGAGTYFNMHQWLMGLMQTPVGREFLSADSKAKLERRLTYRLRKALELYQHQAVVHYREEPFSGIRYAITFNSYYDNETHYAEGTGSSIIYGDADESSTMIPLVAYHYAMQYGEWDFVRANWPYFKEAIRLMFVSDDWAYLGTGCREFGAGIWMDMLNCEYSGLRAYAKFARAVGDDAEADAALYRAVRRAVPTLTRLWFDDYVRECYGAPAASHLVLGYKEEGAATVGTRLSGFLFNGMIDLFSTSQSTDRELVLLYKQYAAAKIGDYMRDVLIPSAAQLKRPFTYEGVRVLALFGGAGAAEVDQAIDDYTPSYPHTTTRPDWPAMNQTATLGDVIFSRHPDVFLIDWTPARLESAWYDPAAGTLAVSLSNHAGSPFAVRLYARRIPTEVRVNGAVVRCVNGAGDAAVSENVWQYERRNGELDIRLTGADAARQVEIRFGGENDYEHPYVRGMRK